MNDFVDDRNTIKTWTYFNEAFADDPSPMIEAARHALKRVKYDTIVGTGLSGALVVPTLARALGKSWAIVRKGESTHSGNHVEGVLGKRWVFVDDFVDSGATEVRVKFEINALAEEYGFATDHVGRYEYSADKRRFTPAK